jgi:DNA topoisomerase I
MKKLIIVESYTKTNTIKKYLNDPNAIVTYSSGHIYNLPKDKLGFDTNTWKIDYVKTNPKIINNIRDFVKKSDIIYLAADPDLEGEAIANSVKNSIKDLIKDKTCHRITFNEITETAVLNAMNNPRIIDMDTVNAQETRRIVDRLIGYKVSPTLWAKFGMNYLSAGRVQIAGLITCINQRNRILNKEIIPYWQIECKFIFNKLSKKDFVMGTLTCVTPATSDTSDTSDTSVTSNNYRIEDIEVVNKILSELKTNTEYSVSHDKKIRKVSPPPPYTTTTMQQDCYNKHRFSAKNTMKLAQDLYENGFITYIRTDSTNISVDAKNTIISYIKSEYSDAYPKYRTYKTKVSNAQEAHEAVRITNPYTKKCDFKNCSSNHIKLYELIRNRTLASLMTESEYADIIMTFKTVDKNSEYSKYIFSATKSFMTFDGFNILYNTKIEAGDACDTCDACEKFIQTLELHKCYSYEYKSCGAIDNIPSMYNEVQLIKELEKEGIGRPSTYSTIVDKLLEKKYVDIGQNPQQEYELDTFIKKYKSDEVITEKKIINIGGKQKDLLIPTELGINIIKYIYEIMPYLCDLKFTSKMESDLDDIINAKNNKKDILDSIYSKITTSLHDICLDNESKNGNCSKEKKEYSTGFVNTRYGQCYYNKEKNAYTNIEPYLKWKKVKVENLKDNEVKFLSSLPKKVIYLSKPFNLHIGKFGLYLKDSKNNNHNLDKKLWDSYIT